MRVAYYEANGSAREVLRVAEVETPQPGRGEVRVKLLASGVNPSDVKSRAGINRKIAFPRVIPHSDGAGEIEAVGEGVPAARVGERVWVWNGQWRRAFGTAAQSIVLPAEQAVPLPANITMEAGACLGIPAYTGYQAVVLAGVGDGATVLIAAGAGAVGHYAIQFAKKRRATVITTVSSPEKAALARQAGADHVIDYKREDVGERVMAITGKRGADAVIEMDLAANAKLLPNVLTPNGVVAIYGGSAPRARDPVPVPAAEQHHAEVLPGLPDAAGAARARHRRHHAHARTRRAHPQRGADLRSRRHRRRPRGGRGRQGPGQYRGEDSLDGAARSYFSPQARQRRA